MMFEREEQRRQRAADDADCAGRFAAWLMCSTKNEEFPYYVGPHCAAGPETRRALRYAVGCGQVLLLQRRVRGGFEYFAKRIDEGLQRRLDKISAADPQGKRRGQ